MIKRWDQFERLILKKFGDDNSPSTLVLEISRIKMENKDNFRDFNQQFMTLLKNILNAS